MTTTRKIHCCGCGHDVQARLTDGSEIYPHRKDLHSLPFWKCDACGNKVGCHHKTKDRTNPLGVIPTPEISKARGHIHKIVDPIWKSGRHSRTKVYKMLSDKLGYKFHTANIRTIEEARTVYKIAKEIT